MVPALCPVRNVLTYSSLSFLSQLIPFNLSIIYICRIISENQLTGTLPSEWADLVKLQEMYSLLHLSPNITSLNNAPESSSVSSYLYSNNLGGTLPKEWSALSQLAELWEHPLCFSFACPHKISTLYFTEIWRETTFLEAFPVNGLPSAAWTSCICPRLSQKQTHRGESWCPFPLISSGQVVVFQFLWLQREWFLPAVARQWLLFLELSMWLVTFLDFV